MESKVIEQRKGCCLSISKYQNEFDLEFHLRAAYYECWNRLISAIEHLDINDLEQLSNPFLIKALPAYRKAKRKVLFVGQETNGWDSFKLTLDMFNHQDEEVRRENVVDCCDIIVNTIIRRFGKGCGGCIKLYRLEVVTTDFYIRN